MKTLCCDYHMNLPLTYSISTLTWQPIVGYPEITETCLHDCMIGERHRDDLIT